VSLIRQDKQFTKSSKNTYLNNMNTSKAVVGRSAGENKRKHSDLDLSTKLPKSKEEKIEETREKARIRAMNRRKKLKEDKDDETRTLLLAQVENEQLNAENEELKKRYKELVRRLNVQSRRDCSVGARMVPQMRAMQAMSQADIPGTALQRELLRCLVRPAVPAFHNTLAYNIPGGLDPNVLRRMLGM
jgi:hypothetical protein